MGVWEGEAEGGDTQRWKLPLVRVWMDCRRSEGQINVGRRRR